MEMKLLRVVSVLFVVLWNVQCSPQPDSVFVPKIKQGMMGQVFVYDSQKPRKLYPVCTETFEQEAADIFCGKYTQSNDVTALILHGDGITYNNEYNDDVSRVVVYSHSIRYLDCFESKNLLDCDFDLVNEYCGRSVGFKNLYAQVACLNTNITYLDLAAKISLSAKDEKWGKLRVRHFGIRGEFCTEEVIPDQIANVTCRELNFTGGAAITVKSKPRSGIDRFSFMPGSLNCRGDEWKLSDCSQPRGAWPFDAGTAVCSENSDKRVSYGAVCYHGKHHNQFSLRLKDGPSHWSGRLEMFYDGKWGTFCDVESKIDRFKTRPGFAETACRLLGYRSGFGVGQSLYGRGLGPILMETRTCDSNDKSLLTCKRFTNNWNDVTMECRSRRLELGVVCFNEVRLRSDRELNGVSYTRQYGHVELLVNDRWRSICSTGWDKDDALVTCRELGYKTGSVVPQHYFPSMDNLTIEDMVVSEVKCSGYEKSLSECPYSIVKQCQQPLAFVVCSNEGINDGLSLLLISLNSTDTSKSGKVGHLLVTLNNQQGYICPTMWDDIAASAACRSLNYAGGVAIKTDIFPRDRKYIISDVDCSRSTDKFSSCDYTQTPPICDNYEPAAVHCYSHINDLFEFSIASEDRSENIPSYGHVMLRYRGLRGSMSSVNRDSSFLSDLAVRICKQLGWMTGEMKSGSNPYRDDGPVWVIPKDVSRCGNNSYDVLKTCTNYISDDNYERSAHQHDVTISCHRNVRLYHGGDLSYKSYGLLQVYKPNNGWIPVCSDNTWSTKQLAAICSQLGGPFGALIEQLPHLLTKVPTNVSSATNLKCRSSQCSFRTIRNCDEQIFLRCSKDAHIDENPWAPVKVEDQSSKPVQVKYENVSSGQKTFHLFSASLIVFVISSLVV